mmetsp:Transcript_11356/g.24215  ORF Transcript_11356/g.24215 Transcript_11356/m.24215 type:complete len:203 (-) Transcript_11356:924-1532(-)
MRIVRQYGIAKSLVAIWSARIRRNGTEHVSREYIIACGIVRAVLRVNPHAASRGGRDAIRPFEPAPAQSFHVARPPRLSRSAGRAFRVLDALSRGRVADAGRSVGTSSVAGFGGDGERAEGGRVDGVGRGIVGGRWERDGFRCGKRCWRRCRHGYSDNFGLVFSGQEFFNDWFRYHALRRLVCVGGSWAIIVCHHCSGDAKA